MKRASLSMYVSGFILSVVLTLGAFWLVHLHLASGHKFLADPLLISLILGLALIQLFVQMFFFLHLGEESSPRWNLQMFGLMIMFALIIVIGSLWIMRNLDYHMAPSQTEHTIIQDEGINK